MIPGSLGILGGTFDPIHHGHLAIAEEVREVLGLERVLFVPASVPPHRAAPPGATAEDRARMVELAIAGNPAFSMSRIELDRDGPSYTVDTLSLLAAERAGRPDPVFILSAEAASGLPDWHDPRGVLRLARLAVVPRAGAPALGPGWAAERFPDQAARFAWLDAPLLPVSGSVVRARAAAGRSVRYLVPEPVARYIDDHRLYRSARTAAAPATAGGSAPLEDPTQ
ncbi:MAG TPA: nicotinate-nucleotide adenylyltransferase [Candidatus Limnocylindrales bacterium]|nr:nicotinate-nucleotide adenylyltransferase [Candidatus Limnocylindrales bacterium]